MSVASAGAASAVTGYFGLQRIDVRADNLLRLLHLVTVSAYRAVLLGDAIAHDFVGIPAPRIIHLPKGGTFPRFVQW